MPFFIKPLWHEFCNLILGEVHMSLLWKTTKLGRLSLPGRLARSAAGEGMCDENFHVTPRMEEYYRELGKDGALGLIITGHAFVSPEGRRRESQTSAASDTDIPGLRRVAAAAGRDGSRVFLQLSHGGLCCEEALTGLVPIGPSDAGHAPEYAGRAMRPDEVKRMSGLFAAAAGRAREAGFDGVQLHMGHGFLLSEFLSPCFNHREDAYGGSQENRTRLAVEVIQAIHAVCGEDYPVIAKINAEDGIENGLTPELALVSARMLETAGLAALEVSGGFCFRKKAVDTPMKPVYRNTPEGGCYFRNVTRRFHAELNIPVIMVGGIRVMETAEEILDREEADIVSMCRPLIRDPSLARRWRAGERIPSNCLSCNRCVALSRTAAGLGCPAVHS